MNQKNYTLTKTLIPVNTPVIDSFTFRIPLDKCEILDKRLTSETCIYYVDLEDSDGEILPPRPQIRETNGIKLRFALCSIPEFNKELNQKVPVKYIYTVLTTKLLRERYFQGINLYNIYDLYINLLNFGIFKCKYEDFLASKVSDIDICMNRYIERFLFPVVLSDLQNTTGTKKKYTDLDLDKQILMFKKRETATPSMPFIKLYNKEFELLNRSAEFWNTYLFDLYAPDIRGLTRIEATIKNYAHKKRLKRFEVLPMFNTIDDLLRLSEKELYNFIVFSVGGYIETPPRKRADGLSPMDHLIYELIINSVHAGHDFESIMGIADSWHAAEESSTPVGRSRMRKRIDRLFGLAVHKDVKLGSQALYNNHVKEYFRFLGINN